MAFKKCVENILKLFYCLLSGSHLILFDRYIVREETLGTRTHVRTATGCPLLLLLLLLLLSALVGSVVCQVVSH